MTGPVAGAGPGRNGRSGGFVVCGGRFFGRVDELHLAHRAAPVDGRVVHRVVDPHRGDLLLLPSLRPLRQLLLRLLHPRPLALPQGHRCLIGCHPTLLSFSRDPRPVLRRPRGDDAAAVSYQTVRLSWASRAPRLPRQAARPPGKRARPGAARGIRGVRRPRGSPPRARARGTDDGEAFFGPPAAPPAGREPVVSAEEPPAGPRPAARPSIFVPSLCGWRQPFGDRQAGGAACGGRPRYGLWGGGVGGAGARR